MMHLRGLVLFLSFLPRCARRSIRIDDYHHDAQQLKNAQVNGFEVSAEAREAFIPWRSGMGVFRRAGLQASRQQYEDRFKPDGRHVSIRAVRFRPGPHRAKVALQAGSGPKEDPRREKGLGRAIADLRGVYARPGVGEFGVGLIAIRAVPKGQRICECEAKYARTVSRLALLALPHEVRTTIHELWDGMSSDDVWACTIPNDYEQAIPLVSFINHSEQPNCVFDADTNSIVTARRLRKGEELTINYLKYQEPGSYTYNEAKRGFS